MISADCLLRVRAQLTITIGGLLCWSRFCGHAMKQVMVSKANRELPQERRTAARTTGFLVPT